MNSLACRSYFFDAGIRFTCRQCGHCCSGDPGVVRVTGPELDVIADRLAIAPSQVIKRYLLTWQDGYRIRETSDGRCLFLGDSGCQIYPVRPVQCRTFPFWLANLRSPTRWQGVVRACPGIGSGRLYTKAEILNILEAGG